MLREGGARDVADVMRVMEDAFHPAYGEAWTRGQCLGILELPRVWLTLARVYIEVARGASIDITAAAASAVLTIAAAATFP